MNKAVLLSQIMDLPPVEQVELVEDVWNRIADNPEKWPPVPPAHLAEARRRLAEHHADPKSGITLEELNERLRSRLK